jgi:amino acid transporter
MFKVLYSYAGWQNVNYVMNDVKDPVRTLKIAGLLALGITATLYIFANIAYFAYVHLYTSEKYGPQT